MGSPADLAFRCRGDSPMAVGNLFKALPKSSREVVDRAQILDEYLKALEDERRKIEAFKRELPHCMQLLEYAIDASRENLVQSPPCSIGHPIVSVVGKTTETLGLFGKQVVQEFLKNRWDTGKDEDSDESEKKKARRSSTSAEERDYPAWMAEAQLWSQPPSRSDTWKEKGSSTEDSVGWKKEVAAEKSTLTSPPALLFSAKQRPGGAFMPFVKEKQAPVPAVRADPGVSDLVLSSGESRRTTVPSFGAVDSEAGSVDGSSKARDVSNGTQAKKEVGVSNRGGIAYSGCTESTTSSGGVAQRKARRCWSPELHRRFVSALQQLGGSQIATPKQIRELMKVDGLTNDEVKSHLQKYRLHTRRPSPTPQGPTQPTQAQVVVLGGLWVPPEYGSTGMYHDHPSSVSVSQAEPIFCQPYPKLPPPPIQIELRRSQSESSPQGPPQSTSNLSSRDPRQTTSAECRDDSAGEDGKSESSSSKDENDSRDSEEKEEVMTVKYESHSKEDDDDDDDDEENTDEGNQDGSDDGEVRLQLEMSCSSAHGTKSDPQTA